MKRLLIGESGGTKTDWCLITNKIVLDRFETESLHPTNLNNELAVRLKIDLSDKIGDFDELMVQLYCAGCVQDEKKVIVSSFFHDIGISNIHVESDLKAAGSVLMSSSPEWIAIMGTGSVVFLYENNSVQQIIGGKGHLFGDEGSGYFFGKLVLQAQMNDKLTGQQALILSKVCHVEELTEALKNGTGKYRIAQLSTLLSAYKDQFESFHEQNFEQFFQHHLFGSDIKEISVVGGYAFYHQEQLLKILDVKGIKIKRLINRPLDLLIERSVTSTN